MKKNAKKSVAILLIFVMLMSMQTVPVFAASHYVDREDAFYSLISQSDWELAPGITESEIVLNNEAGTQRQVAHVVEVDMNNQYTKVIPSYKGMKDGLDSKCYATEVMSKQAAYAEANGYGNVVAAMNLSLSWYDSDYYHEHPELVGEPLGYMILDGVQYTNSQGQTGGAQTCVVINFDEKDGVARPVDIPKTQIRSTADPITGWEEQVIPANFGFLVKNGLNQYEENHRADGNNSASRSFVGIKADGTLVMVMNDGRQAPYSTGFTNYEMAEFMLSLGCVQAVNGDGGGSSTFLSQRPGEELKLNCSPSDGAERETTHGILVISTAPATGEFSRASISSEYDYYTPNSEVVFDAVGSDLVGTAASIPEDVTWQLADSSYGTIENGLFTSTGKEGDVVVQMVYNGKVVGEDTIHIVMPDKIAFEQENMVVPYGKNVELGIKATYDSKTVCIKPADVKFELSDSTIGEINELSFTASNDGEGVATSAKLTAKIGELLIETGISLGKGSEIVYNFEDDDVTDLENWTVASWYPQYGPKGSLKDNEGNYWYNGQNEIGSLNIVTAENGKVKNGQKSLAVFCDFTKPYETGYLGVKFMFPEPVNCEDAIAVGFWMYVPYDARHAEIRLVTGKNASTVSASTVYDNGQLWDLVEGWNYIKLDITQLGSKTFNGFVIQVDDRACASTGSYYDYITEPNLNGTYTFYVDDISLDYSTAVDDREAPIFENVKVNSNESVVDMNGQTIANNDLAFEVKVAENTKLSNATGLDESTVKAYIDGKTVDYNYANGRISINNVKLTDGIHTVKFEVSDKAGNKAWKAGTINVQTESEASTIKVVPKDATLDKIKVGSLYWMDIIATDIESVDKVELTFDMNNASTWELKGMTTAAGFTAAYTEPDEDNIVHITITKTGLNTETGEVVLATFPVRAWESKITECEGYEDQTPATLVKRGIIWAQSIELQLKHGEITYAKSYANDTTGTFGMEDLIVDTELFFTNYTRKNVEGAQEWINNCTSNNIGFHEHTIQADADAEATCTSVGYTGRTSCNGCGSVIDWGEITPVKNHSYSVIDGVLKCECGQTLTGIHTDGRYYENGILVSDGWNADHTAYFKDGVKLTGQHYMDGKMYSFDENGVYLPNYSYTGFYQDENGWMYFLGNFQKKGFVVIDGDTYYFDDKTGYAPVGSFTLAGDRVYKVEGEKGKVLGAWDTFTENGVERKRYYYSLRYYKNQWLEVDGETYYFNNDGYALIGKRAVAAGGQYLGGYEFDNDGKLVGKINGPFTDAESGYMYFAEDGVLAHNKLVKFNDDYYFARNNYLLITWSTTLTEEQTNGLLPAGEYKFGADGKLQMLNGPVKDPFNDAYWNFYKDGVRVYKEGLYQYDGDYYYVRSNGLLLTWNMYISEEMANGLLPAGEYQFGADGKLQMLNGPVKDAYNDAYWNFYKDGVRIYEEGLYQYNGDYYYVRSNGLLLTWNMYISEEMANGLLPAGEYQFGSDGKLQMLNGPVQDAYNDAYLNFYIDGVRVYEEGLYKYGNDYYYVRPNGLLLTWNSYIEESKTNGLLPAGEYKFGADGKLQMLNGPVEDAYNDAYWNFYKDGVRVYEEGLYKYGNDYYYVRPNGLLLTWNSYIEESKTNGLLPAGEYQFGADGKLKMLNGPVKDAFNESYLNFYKDGVRIYKEGLYEYDGSYYYVRANGLLLTWDAYIAEDMTNGLLPAGDYHFGADGKLIVE